MNRSNEVKMNAGIFQMLYFLTFGKQAAYCFYSSSLILMYACILMVASQQAVFKDKKNPKS